MCMQHAQAILDHAPAVRSTGAYRNFEGFKRVQQNIHELGSVS